MATLNTNFRRMSKDFELTVTVTMTREWRIRQAVALSLVKLAAWVLGGRARVIKEEETSK